MSARLKPRSEATESLLIEGYASLFNVEDRGGDVVRPGAFASSLASGLKPMLLQHKTDAVSGRWVRMIEDGRGLFVRGLINAPTARRLAENGLSGLSIGFRPQVWTLRAKAGRTLMKVDLVEVSLVAEPMLDSARFKVISGLAQ